MDNSIAGLVTDAANRYGQDPATALRIADIESGGKDVTNSSSGAAGIYQFMPSTWSSYGNGASPHDIPANIDAGMRLLRDNRAGLTKALGREPTGGELYLAHQQGLGGATKLLANPDLAAASIVGAKAVTGNGGTLDMTAGQFAHKWTSAVDGHAPTVANGAPGGFTPRTVGYTDLMAPPAGSFGPHDTAPSAPSDVHDDLSMADAKAGWDYYSTNSLTARAYHSLTDPSFAPDPHFAPTSDDIKAYATGPDGRMLPPEYLSRFASATSDGQAKWIAQRAWDEEAKTQKVEQLGNGWNAQAIKFATMLLDPASLGLGVATDGVLSPAAQVLGKFGLAGRIASGALTGGVSNVAITAASQGFGAPTENADYLNALALGMTLGGAFGPLARSGPKAAGDMAIAGKSLRENVAAKEAGRAPAVEYVPMTEATAPWDAPPAAPHGQGSSVGAAFDPFAHTPLELKTGDWGSVRDEGQFTSNFTVEGARKSNFLLPATGTQTASSPFAEHRMFGAFLGDNVFGYADHANPINAAMVKDEIRDQAIGQMNRWMKPAFDEWSEAKGYSAFDRLSKRPEFESQVYDYMTKADPGTEYHPAVMRAADRGVRPIYKDLAERLHRAGVTDDMIADPNYLPRIFDPRRISDAYQEFGSGVMAKAVRAAMEDMPWVEHVTPERLDDISRGYASGIAKRALDLDDHGRAFSGHDLERLHSVLMEDGGLGSEEARGVVDKMHALTDNKDGSRGSARLKSKVDLDIHKRITLPDGRSLSLSDLVHKGVGHLTERYTDQMAGRVALAEMHVVDPATGESLLKGIRSEGDFNKALGDMRRNIQERYLDKATSPAERENMERWRKYGEANMKFMYDRIMSKPMNAPGGAGRALRLLRKYTFARMMGATGWSHLSIFASNLGNGGLAASLQHVPALRHIMSQDGEWIRAHGLDRELEAMFGNHTDPLRGLQLMDWGHDPAKGTGLVDKAEHKLDQINKTVAIASGLSHIVDLNTRWAQKIMAQKFADMARKPTVETTKRMMALGLDKDGLGAVLDQVRQHATTERGILFDHKLTKLNLDKWDQETAYKFQAAIGRYVSRVVQHNDVSASARWISNPAWQLFMQFRNFPMVGLTKQLSYNIVMHDREAAQYAMTAMAFSALTYYAKTQVNAIGRSDRQEYLQRALAPGEIARSTAHHSGLFGLLPAFIDTGMRMAGADPMFDFRSTGLPSELWAAPGLKSLDDAQTAVKALADPIKEGRSRSQAEYRAILRMLPWNNIPGMVQLQNAMISGAPLHAPSRLHQAH